MNLIGQKKIYLDGKKFIQQSGNMELETFYNNYTGEKASIEERFMTKGTLQLVKEIVKDKTVLNLGLGNGLISKTLEPLLKEQVVIEGSRKILNDFSYISNKTTFIHSYFEDYSPEKEFDIILANHVLEHVSNPVDILKNKISKWLKPDGFAFITVPNAKSMHRLIGREMGLLGNEYQLNNSDIKAGHQRVYDQETLHEHIKKSNLTILESGGYNLKLVSLAQMKDWSQELLDAIFEISKTLPAEICSNLWVKVKRND